MSSSYGGYYGGDPRKFFPDEECCSPAELKAHKEHCDAWNRGLRPEPGGHISEYDKDGRLILHIARNPFGLGITVFDDEDPEEEQEEDRELSEMDDEELLGVYLSNAGKDSEEAARILAERHGVELSEENEQ
jgi:hypothetical protein